MPQFFIEFIFFLDSNFQHKITSLLKDLYTYSHLGLAQQLHDYTAYEGQAKFSCMNLNKERQEYPTVARADYFCFFFLVIFGLFFRSQTA